MGGWLREREVHLCVKFECLVFPRLCVICAIVCFQSILVVHVLAPCRILLGLRVPVSLFQSIIFGVCMCPLTIECVLL